MKSKIFVLTVLSILFVGRIYGIEVLNSHFGPRPLSLGGAYIAVGGDPEAVFWNPGGIPTVNSFILSSGYQSSIGGLDFLEVYTAIAVPKKLLKFGGTIGLGFVYWSASEEGWNDVNESTGLMTAQEYTVAVGYKKEFGGIINVGATVKYAGSDIAGVGDNAVVLDIGGLANIDRVGLGLLVKNIGFSSSTIPIGMSLGAYYEFFVSKNNNHIMAGAVELDSVMEMGFVLKFGFEYSWYGLSMYDGFIKLRVGYDTTSSKELGALSGFSSGIGVSYFGITLNYTMLTLGLMGFNHDITLAYNVDNAILRKAVKKDGKAPEINVGVDGSTVIVQGEKGLEKIKIKYRVIDAVGINKINVYVLNESGETIRHQKISGLRGLKEYDRTYVWDGKDEAKQPALDGVYVVSVEAEDLNLNQNKAEKRGLVVTSYIYAVVIGAEPNKITTIGETIKLFSLRKIDRGLKQWRITIKDEKGVPIKRFGKKAKSDKVSKDKTLTPEEMMKVNTIKFEDAIWDGTDSKGNLVDNGKYTAVVEVEYDNGIKYVGYPLELSMQIGN